MLDKISRKKKGRQGSFEIFRNFYASKNSFISCFFSLSKVHYNFSNYLNKPQNVDVNYQMNLVMKINKYMSANLSMQAIYDDNAIQAVQVRELFGMGIIMVFN